MSITLNSALSGLKAAQQALDTISTNIANASTPGYTRKILPQETQIVGGTGSGVLLQSLVRIVDSSLVRDLNKQSSVNGATTTEQKYLQRIQDFHGASDAERSISAQMGRLADSFATLSAAPDNSIYLDDTLSVAQATVTKFHDFSSLINQMRTDTETEIGDGVRQVNELIDKIARTNLQIAKTSAAGQSFADLEDQRDNAMKDLSKFMEISTFQGDDHILVVQTKQGQILADGLPHKLVFNKSNLTPNSYNPGGGANSIYLDSLTGSTLGSAQLGGSLGALLTLRDDTLPTYQAQLDELAQKMAARFDGEGLRLFTNSQGNVPASTTYPAPTGYVGFAGEIRVNTDIINDPTLLRNGTYGATVAPGSNEIISKVITYAFGAYAYQQANGTANISAGTIYASTGLSVAARLSGNTSITTYAPDLDAAPNITAPATFNLTVGATTHVITISPGDTATTLVNSINTAFGSSISSLNGLGQLVLNTNANITIANGTIGAAGMTDLGFSFGTTTAVQPSFTVQVGSQSAVTVPIGPTTTAANLLATLNAIPGLTASLDGSGKLVMRPTHGGALTIENTSGTPLNSLGMAVTDVAHTAFRQSNLGPAANLSTGILGNSSLEDYTRAMVSDQSEDASLANDSAEKESSFLETLTNRLSNQSGVNVDEELSNLIRIQTAYTAAARMIGKTEELFNTMLEAFN